MKQNIKNQLLIISILLMIILSLACSKEKQMITSPELMMLEKPILKSKIIAKLKQGAMLKIIEKKRKIIQIDGKKGSWFKVENDDKMIGWVFSTKLTSNKNKIQTYRTCNKKGKVIYKDKCIERKKYECDKKGNIFFENYCISKKMKRFLSGKGVAESECKGMASVTYYSNKKCRGGNSGYGFDYGKWKLQKKDSFVAAKCSFATKKTMGSYTHFLIDTNKGLMQVRNGKIKSLLPPSVPCW